MTDLQTFEFLYDCFAFVTARLLPVCFCDVKRFNLRATSPPFPFKIIPTTGLGCSVYIIQPRKGPQAVKDAEHGR